MNMHIVRWKDGMSAILIDALSKYGMYNGTEIVCHLNGKQILFNMNEIVWFVLFSVFIIQQCLCDVIVKILIII